MTVPRPLANVLVVVAGVLGVLAGMAAYATLTGG